MPHLEHLGDSTGKNSAEHVEHKKGDINSSKILGVMSKQKLEWIVDETIFSVNPCEMFERLAPGILVVKSLFICFRK